MLRKKIGVFFRQLMFIVTAALFWVPAHNVFAWTNPGFETGNLTGWTSLTNVGPAVACNPSVSVVPIGPAINTNLGQLNDIHTGSYAVQLFSGRGDNNHDDWAQVSQTDTVPSGSGCLSFWFAGIFENYHYLTGDIYGDAYLQINIIIGGVIVATINYNWPNNLAQIILSGLTGNGNYAACSSSGTLQWGYVPWTNYIINLSAYAGQQATLQATMYDCDAGGHYGVGYLDDVSWISCPPTSVSLTKSNNPTGTVNMGAPITYTLSYANTGGTGVAGMEVNDTIPTGTSLVPGSINSNPILPFTSQIGNDIIWNVGYVAPGASGSVTFAVAPNSCAESVTNVARETDLEGDDLLSNKVVNAVAPCIPTSTNTPTVTNTFTNTNTPTKTETATNTNTSTVTESPTNTSTSTVTHTPTNTSTSTDSPTMTYTQSATSTPTTSNTPTNSATFTQTSTVSYTHTQTSTQTATFTATRTNSPTYSPTNTSTATGTSTSTSTTTASSTPTVTRTSTASATSTMTATCTNTPPVSVSFGKMDSEQIVAGGDILTYSIGITVTGSTALNAIVTDTLPAFMTFHAFGTDPLGTTASFDPNSDLLSWALPSPLAAGTYQLTYSTQVAPAAPGNRILTNYAQLGYGGSPSRLHASVPVTVLGQYTVRVNIYNSAGEVVRTILIQQYSQPISNISLSTSNQITTLQGPGSTIYIIYSGSIIGAWDGNNNQGQPVSNGTYSIQVDSTAQNGTVTTVSQTAIVNRNIVQVTVLIFNSAGEEVRALYQSVSDATNSMMNEVAITPDILKPKSGPPAQIVIQNQGAPVTLFWDGTNNQGRLVTPGIYSVQIHWALGNPGTQTIIRSITVMPSQDTDAVIARPNVLNPANGMMTTFDASAVVNAYSLKVQVYTLLGQLLRTLNSPMGSPQVDWNATGLASGLYVAVLFVQSPNGGVIGTQRLKVLVIH